MVHSTVGTLLLASVCPGAGAAAQAAAPNEALLRMVCDVLGDVDPRMLSAPGR